MTTYILVHGAFHGGWCWDKVVPLLESAGHQVLAPDLPGHGADKTPTAEVTLQGYVDKICTMLDEQSEPVILVGHSMAGVVITQVAEQRPDKIQTLVYLTAMLPDNGQCIFELRDQDSLSARNRIWAEDKKSVTMVMDAVQEIFYGDCAVEDVARAKSLLVPQATEPFFTAVKTSTENFGRVPRVYIQCRQDKAISLETQQRMVAALPCEKVISMNTSHSPFFSTPQLLADHLLDL